MTKCKYLNPDLAAVAHQSFLDILCIYYSDLFKLKAKAFLPISSIIGEEGKPLLKFFQSVSHVMMKLTGWIVCLAPCGVAFLIAGEILHMKSVLGELNSFLVYFSSEATL